MQLTVRDGEKRPTVQILVVVANIQMRTLKTEVGKGFTCKQLDVVRKSKDIGEIRFQAGRIWRNLPIERELG